MKKENGITLISLVVTIIILIILSGISINLILGQDGIINKAKEAKQNIELAQIEEQEQLNTLYDQMIGESNGSLSYDESSKLIEFKKEIASAITDMGIETSKDADATTMANNIKNIINNASASSINYNNTNSGLLSTNVQSAVDEVNENIENNKFKNLDYSKKVNLGIEMGNGSFTAPKDGFIIGNVDAYENNCGIIEINGQFVTRWKTGSVESQWNYFPVSIPIKKGDVFTISSSAGDASNLQFRLFFYSI